MAIPTDENWISFGTIRVGDLLYSSMREEYLLIVNLEHKSGNRVRIGWWSVGDWRYYEAEDVTNALYFSHGKILARREA